MKKCVAITLALMLGLAVCTLVLFLPSREGEGNTPVTPPDPFDEAVAYIASGEIEEAYYALRALAEAGDGRAEAKLTEFSLVYLSRSDSCSDGRLDVTEYTYDEGGKLLSSVVRFSDGTSRSCEYTYDGDTLVSESYVYPNDETITRTYTRDRAGRVLCARTTALTGYSYEYSYEYDADGRVVLECFSDGEGERSRIEYTYADGRPVRECHTYAAGGADTYEHFYDGEGNITREVRTYSSGAVDEHIFTYDERGNLTSETVEYSDGRTERRECAYTYDVRGNITTETHTSPDADTKTVTYFDYRVYYKGK